MRTAATTFSSGRPAGISNVVRDASGRLVAWVENGFACTVERDAAGALQRIVAQNGEVRLVQVFSYVAGDLIQMAGDIIPTSLMPELVGGTKFNADLGVNGEVLAVKYGDQVVIGTAFSFVSYTLTTPGVTQQWTWAVPQVIQDRGGYIYVDGAAGGGGGGGGSTDTGGGGGGSGRGCSQLPVYVPQGTSLLYIQVGRGGPGGAGNGAGNGAAGTAGDATHIRVTSHFGPALLILTGGGAGNGGVAGGAGGAGGQSGGWFNSGGAGGTGAGIGGGGAPSGNSPGAIAIVSQTGSLISGGGGGGGAGATAAQGGPGGFGVAQHGNPGAGAGAGGGGGAGPWARSPQGSLIPAWGQSGSGGTGGAGGGSPTAGASANLDSFGGGGGGGGRGQAGGSAGDGFLRLAY